MAKIVPTKTENDVENAENVTLKKNLTESPKTGYTIKEATDILIERVLKKWKIKNQ